MAERTALIRPLLEYVLVEALTQRQKWSRDGIDLTVSVNISARNLLDLGVVDQVRRALELACAPPEALIIEITETASVTDLPVAVESLDRLHRLGVVLAIDDYGTGYSSLAYMQRLPVQQLKIDRAFVTDMRTVDAHRIIVRSTIDLARTLGLTITAEGVEDRETLLDLKRLSCHCAQGYHLGRPVPALDIPESVAALNAELSNNAEVP
ncbi:MAG: EAL domain-containing protein [Rhodococcus sp. (in: high G+C Gram-positive bacteria)]